MSEAVERHRALRKAATDAEQLLWRHLRNRDLNGYKFRRQYSVAPYIVDFMCLIPRVGVEIDGGGHFEPEKIVSDEERSEWLYERGVYVIRFTNTEVLFETEAVLQRILDTLEGFKR
jgi:very-short-patch-repair endonuclease